MNIFINVSTLHEMLKKEDSVVPIDVRFNLQDTSYGRWAYEKEHIPGAVYLDLDEDLSGNVRTHGGAHPLPSIESFSKKLGALGIDQQTTVVIYSDTNDMYVARAWWLMYYVGHKDVYILDGGFKRWKEAGYRVSHVIPTHTPKTFKPQLLNQAVANIKDVKEKMKNSSAILIDSRSRERYLGKKEPLYEKAGHIPGARNFFWKDVLHEDGTWKSKKELQNHFSSLPKTSEIIVSCGSGVSACANVIGLLLAGYKHVTLYPGSYSDWISYENNPVETKDES